MTGTCEKCKYAKWDELWGEYKCLKNSRRVHEPEKPCEDFEKKDAE